MERDFLDSPRRAGIVLTLLGWFFYLGELALTRGLLYALHAGALFFGGVGAVLVFSQPIRWATQRLGRLLCFPFAYLRAHSRLAQRLEEAAALVRLDGDDPPESHYADRG